MRRSRGPLLCLLLLVSAAPANAEAPRRTHTITVDDYFDQATIFESVISPDGQHVAYTEGRWQKSTDDRKPDLWVVESKTGKVRRLTFDRAMDRLPQWSPDSRQIYFLSNCKRAGEKQPGSRWPAPRPGWPGDRARRLPCA